MAADADNLSDNPLDSTDSSTVKSGPNTRQRLQRWLGITVSLAILGWVVYQIHPERLTNNISTLDWRWVTLAVLFDLLTYSLQGLRWKLLLNPITRVPVGKVTQAIYIGLFVNGVLPLRSGKWLRALLVARWGGVKVSEVLSTILLEWYIEWMVLVFTVVVASAVFPFPPGLQKTGRIISIIMASLVITAVVTGIWQRNWWRNKLNQHQEGQRWRRFARAQDFLSSFIKSVYRVTRTRDCLFALLVTLLMPFCQTLAIWSLFIAYHLELSFIAALVVFFIINLGTAIPNAPGNVGSFQLAVVFGLTIFGVTKSLAAEFSVVAFIVLTLPYLVGGFIAILMTRLSLTELRRVKRA